MQKRFLRQLQLLGCSAKKILIAVSGGLDSVVLTDLLVKGGYEVGIAHANFQLRGAESVRDEAFVVQLGTLWKIPVFIRHFDTNKYAIKNGVSVQMAARELRYAWFDELREKEKYDLIATAHHLNDALETTLLNLIRGTGLSGLTGIPSTNEKIVRPLLIFSKEEMEDYAKKQNLSWCEDSSNAGDDYQRNIVRHRIIPQLKEINPSLEDTYERTLGRLNAAEELMNRELKSIREKYVSHQDGTVRILKQLMADLQHPAGVLWELVKDYGFNFVQCEGIVEASRTQPGKIFLSRGFQLVIDREMLLLSTCPEVWTDVVIAEDQADADLGPWHMKIQTKDRVAVLPDPLTALLDKRKLTFPLVWRQWKAGDAFHPLGMEHRKKISDFLIDKKVSGIDKNVVTVLESGGEVAWVVGHRIDDRFKITGDTQSVVVVSIRS